MNTNLVKKLIVFGDVLICTGSAVIICFGLLFSFMVAAVDARVILSSLSLSAFVSIMLFLSALGNLIYLSFLPVEEKTHNRFLMFRFFVFIAFCEIVFSIIAFASLFPSGNYQLSINGLPLIPIIVGFLPMIEFIQLMGYGFSLLIIKY
jgi:hypothetical protein